MPARLSRMRFRPAIRLVSSPSATLTSTRRLPDAISPATAAASAGSPPRRRNRDCANRCAAQMLKISVARQMPICSILLRRALSSTSLVRTSIVFCSNSCSSFTLSM